MTCRQAVAMDQANLLKVYRSNHPVEIDACMAPIITELNRRGVETISCCCGHGKRAAHIMLADRTVITLFTCAVTP